jgi:hypothetical protein
MKSAQASLTIDLQDGFYRDTVVLSVDGKEVFRKESVTTLQMLGYAESTKALVALGNHELKVFIPTRGLTDAVTVAIQDETFLGVSLRAAGIDIAVTREPFGYA